MEPVMYETGIPGLVWHGVKHDYSITHAKSGYTLMTGIWTQSGVQFAIKWLQSLPIDWTECLEKLEPTLLQYREAMANMETECDSWPG